MRQIIGYTLMYSGMMFLLTLPFLIGADLSDGVLNHLDWLIEIIIYSILAILISYKVWWIHKDNE